jgi:hypothetical protein
MMAMTFTDPMATAMAFHLASPVTGLAWLAPLGFAAAVGMVVLVARAVVRERQPRPEEPALDLKQAA